MKRYFTLIASLLLITSCGDSRTQTSSNNNEAEATTYAPGTRRMPRTVIDPAKYNTKAEYRRHLVDRYWDGFDFEADSAVIAYDTTDMVYAMVDYVQLIEPERADSLMRQLMHRAERSRPVLDFFTTIVRMVLDDPNSPLRNNEYYIPVLEVLCSSPLLDEYDRLIPAHDLEIALKNRIGEISNDFVYTLTNGRRARLHSIEADYTLLMFNNPGCPLCRELTTHIIESPMLNELTELGRLRTIAIYPDADLAAWRSYQPNMPSAWISGYDAGEVISRERLYDLRAIPALYLLDSQKRVLVKDGIDVAYIEYIIAKNEAERE